MNLATRDMWLLYIWLIWTTHLWCCFRVLSITQWLFVSVSPFVSLRFLSFLHCCVAVSSDSNMSQSDLHYQTDLHFELCPCFFVRPSYVFVDV